MEWRDTTIIIKFNVDNVIIFVRLEQWDFSLLNCNKNFQVLESGISELAQFGSIFRAEKQWTDSANSMCYQIQILRYQIQILWEKKNRFVSSISRSM